MAPDPARARGRLLRAGVCIVLGTVAFILIFTGRLFWAIIPAGIGVVLAVRGIRDDLRRLAAKR